MRRGFAHTYGNGDCNSYSYGHSNSYRDSDRYSYSNSNRDANGYQRAEVDTDAEAASDSTASSLVRNAIRNLLRWKLASPLTGRLKSSLQQTSFTRIDFARSDFGVRCVFASLSRNESIKMGKKV